MKMYLPTLAVIALFVDRTGALDGCITYQEVSHERTPYSPPDIKLQDLGGGQKVFVEIPPVSTGKTELPNIPTEQGLGKGPVKGPPTGNLPPPPNLVPNATKAFEKAKHTTGDSKAMEDMASQLKAQKEHLKKPTEMVEGKEEQEKSSGNTLLDFLSVALNKRRGDIMGLPQHVEEAKEAWTESD